MKTFTKIGLALLIGLSAAPSFAKPYDDELLSKLKHHPTTNSVPGINASNLGIVIGLLAGAVAIGRETRKRN